MRVHRAQLEDVQQLLPLIEAYWQFESLAGFDPKRIASGLAELLSRPQQGACWIATAAGRPVGYLLGVYVFSLEHFGLTAEIDELYVVPASRGSGVGRALIETAEACFRDAGCSNVSLQLALGNAPARAFYRRMDYAPRERFVLLEKPL